MATFIIKDHYRLLTSAIVQDIGQKKNPDFYFNIFCGRSGSSVYKIPERILTAFSPELRAKVNDAINKTPQDQWLEPIIMLLERVTSKTMTLLVALLATGSVDVESHDLTAFKASVYELKIPVSDMAGNRLQTRPDSNGISSEFMDDGPLSEASDGIPDEKPPMQRTVPQAGQSQYLLCRESGCDYRCRSSKILQDHQNTCHPMSSQNQANSSDESEDKGPVNKRQRREESDENQMIRSNRMSAASTSSANVTPLQQQRRPPQLTTYGQSGLSSAGNGQNGSGGGHGVFTCQVTGCGDSFPSFQESVKHYNQDHSVLIFKNNGEYKPVNMRG